jgi:hypothetical protein
MDYDPLGDLPLLSPPVPDQIDTPVAVRSEQVQFTVYRPKAVRPGEWRPMLAYVHLADSRPDAPPGTPTPMEQVQALADLALGSDLGRFRGTTADATQDVPREGEITIIPAVAGIEFNPERRTFKWVQDVQEERFLLRAGRELDGRTARGRVSAYLGVLLIADVELAIRVDAALAETATNPVEAVRARTFRNIFASYSHADTEIVRQFEAYAATLGDRYLRDVRDLRAGQAWQPALLRLIDRADVFQLFWSSTAMRSRHVRTEWEYALSLKRQDFVRPTYWEEPLPSAPEEGLPPKALSAIEFQRISLGTARNDVPLLPGDPFEFDDDTAVSPPSPSVTLGRIPRHVDVDAAAQRRMYLAGIEGILARAHRLYDEGRLDLALAACHEALTLDSAHTDATTLHGKVVAAIAREGERREHTLLRQTWSAPASAPSQPPTEHDTGPIAYTKMTRRSRSAAPRKRVPTLRWVLIALVALALVLALMLAT